MPQSKVTDCLDRARDCAAEADGKTGAEQQRLMSLAEDWLKLAQEAADDAIELRHTPKAT